jgi:hypothetical protein
MGLLNSAFATLLFLASDPTLVWSPNQPPAPAANEVATSGIPAGMGVAPPGVGTISVMSLDNQSALPPGTRTR